LGHDAGFWLRLEANYQQDLVRLQQLDELEPWPAPPV
jgi:hypothetical protein